MSKRKRKHKLFTTTESNLIDITLNPNKFYIKKIQEGEYAIMYASEIGKICIATYKDKNDEYAMNCTIESLEYLTRKI